ncbi:Glutathione transport system permease protein GsiD [subsurface metagenome]
MADNSLERAAERKRHSVLVDFGIRLMKEKPLGMVCGVITLLLLFTGIFADFIAPYGMNETWVGDYLEPPSASFWLGTDALGRDVLSRVIFGARISVIVGLAASALATILSIVIGIMSGYIGGKLDLIVQRVVDTWMCLPSLIILIILVSIMGPSLWSIIIALGFSWGIPGSRIIRGAAITVKENVYVQAAEAIGCSTTRILTRHILPNITAIVIVLFSIRVPGIILSEASLSFLGFGIPPPAPSWGSMLSGTGRSHMFQSPGLAVWPGLALAITVYSINMFGDAVRDLLDPRLRGGIGRYGVRVKKEAKK